MGLEPPKIDVGDLGEETFELHLDLDDISRSLRSVTEALNGLNETMDLIRSSVDGVDDPGFTISKEKKAKARLRKKKRKRGGPR